MNRLGLQASSTLDPEAKALYNRISAYTNKKYQDRPPITKLAPAVKNDNANADANGNGNDKDEAKEEGHLIGPFGIILHTPTLGHAFLSVGEALQQSTPMGRLTPYGREVAIVLVGARHRAAYELYAHCILAERAGLARAQVDAIVAGRKPADLSAEGHCVYDVAWELVHGAGVLSAELWERGVRELGREGVTAVVYYVGFYAFVCTMLRGFDAKVPADGEAEMKRLGLI